MPSRVLYLQAEKAFGQWMASNKKDGFKSNSSKAAMTDLSTSYLSSQVAEGVCDLRDKSKCVLESELGQDELGSDERLGLGPSV